MLPSRAVLLHALALIDRSPLRPSDAGRLQLELEVIDLLAEHDKIDRRAGPIVNVVFVGSA